MCRFLHFRIRHYQRIDLRFKQFDISFMELHHVLPWSRFPELRAKKSNQLLLCHDCHKEIHCNPYLNIRLMEDKAKEFGIDLKERYKYE